MFTTLWTIEMVNFSDCEHIESYLTPFTPPELLRDNIL